MANLPVERCDEGYVDDGAAAAASIHRLLLRHGCGRATKHIEGADQIYPDDKAELLEVQGYVVAIDRATWRAEAGGVHTRVTARVHMPWLPRDRRSPSR